MSTTNTASSGTASNHQMRTLVSLSLLGIVLSWIFFVVAFFMTNYNSRHEVPYFNVNICGTTNITQNAVSDMVHEVMYSKEYQKKLKRIVSDRERIVKREHDQFRAELGTWLSIFGFLSILATIMVSVLSFACQHLSLKGEKDEISASLNKLSTEQEEEKKQLEEAKMQVSEAKAQVVKVRKQVAEITAQVKKAETKVAEAESLNETMSRNYKQSVAASEALALDAQSDSSASNETNMELANIERKCKQFINMWWWKNDEGFDKEIDKKITTGIDVLRKFNDLLSMKISDEEDITPVLNKLNLINIYLGQKEKIDPFYTRFLEALRHEKPLQIRIDDIEKALKHSGAEQLKKLAGFYKTLQERQD